MNYERQFIDGSKTGDGHKIVAWRWDFGDDYASTEQNPTHIYDEKGEYEVTLTAWNDCGRSETLTKIEKIGGDNNMGTYTEPIVVMDGSMITINVPADEPTLPTKFLFMGTPMVSKVVELLTEDGATVLQTQTTNAEGIVTFENVLHGHYNVKIDY